jgi:hypothetical protein
LHADLPIRAEVIAYWFLDSAVPLRKTLINVGVEGARYAVRKVWALQADWQLARGIGLLPRSDRLPWCWN